MAYDKARAKALLAKKKADGVDERAARQQVAEEMGCSPLVLQFITYSSLDTDTTAAPTCD